ncbi:MurR/RpiR family transcriptional regulator [Kribbella sp. NPDC050820]|uniref:MurR/RpiR family transcriptional regulator n=1 Tax=Kribbella sp. NPDC050820 TaxID=3155408 RepID=UPI0034006606
MSTEQAGRSKAAGRPDKPAETPKPLMSGTVLARIKSAMPSLVPSAARAMDVVLSDPEAVVHYATADLAERAGTAASTVIRACQQAGFDGFQDLKLALVRDLAQASTQPLVHAQGLNQSSTPTEVLHAMLHASSTALTDAVATVSTDAFSEATAELSTRSAVLVIGNGQSAAPARDAAYRLRMLGLVTSAPADALAQHLAARQLDASGLCLAVSHTGATRETLLAAETARSRGAYVLSITSFVHSPLALASHAALVAGSSEQGFRLEASASRLAHLAVVDALFVAVALRHPDRSRKYLDAMADISAAHSV